MALTRSQGTMIGVIMVLCVLLFIQWVHYNGGKATARGPNPDGSWGEYAGSMVQVNSIQIKFGDEDEAMIFFTIDMGNGKKYAGHVTIPVHPLTKED